MNTAAEPIASTGGISSLSRRRSVRRYEPRPVPDDLVDRLIEAAAWAPSAHNRQPWRFVVLQTPASKEGLATAMGERLRHDRLADSDDTETVTRDVARSRARLVGAPVVVVIGLVMEEMDAYPDLGRRQAEFLMAVQSTAMAAQNLLLAAATEGLGACIMCAPLFCGDAVRDALRLDAGFQPQMLVTLGYPSNAGRPGLRRPVSEIVEYRR